MFSLETMNNIKKYKIEVLESIINVHKIVLTILKVKNIRYTNQGIQTVKDLIDKYGFQTYYKSNAFIVCKAFEDPTTKEFFLKKLVTIPCFKQHEKFYFKKSGQYLIGKLTNVQEELNFLKEVGTEILFEDYEKAFKAVKAIDGIFSTTINYDDAKKINGEWL